MAAPTKPRQQPPLRPWADRASLTLRLVAAIGGGYVGTVALASAGALLLVRLGGMPRSEAVTLAAMLGFILYLVLLLWAISEPRLWRVWAFLLSTIGTGLALQHSLAPAPVGA